MMEAKDWISFFVGLVVAALGVVPILNKMNVISFTLPLPVNIFAFIVAGAGFYLMVDSFIEITNSNTIGWFSFLLAILFLAVGVMQTLHGFDIGPAFFALSFISDFVYYIIFIVEGLFLMIACFAMEI